MSFEQCLEEGITTSLDETHREEEWAKDFPFRRRGHRGRLERWIGV